MKALILVDIQNDFLPGGALAVKDGDQIIPVVNALQASFPLVVATQDWHPADHGSFAANHPGKALYEEIDLNGLSQVLWPVHCVQGTSGAEFSEALDQSRIAAVFQKGTDAGIDSYSGFFDNGRRKSTGLDAYLKSQGVTSVYVVGLAADFCVKFTALDAALLGYETHVIREGTKGVNLEANHTDLAFEALEAAGCTITNTSLLTSLS